jgi:adenylate cyclase
VRAAPVPDLDLLRLALQSLSQGVAVAQRGDLAIALENARFFKWFPPGPDADATLLARIPDLDLERASRRLDQGRPFSFESEARQGARTVPLRVELRPLPEHEQDFLLVECHDISKQKEAEYMLDSYSRLSEKHTRELQKEKDRVEKLLLNIMPKAVYEELKDFGSTTPQRFDQASVMMLDFVGFTEMAVSRDPSALVAELNDIFSAFDRIVELFGCERIKTIGDAYLAVSGLPEATPDHAHNIAKVALRMRRYLEKRNAAHPETWRCRIGINSGPVIGSIVGIHKYVYDIFGPGVNLAARMERLSDAMAITLCEDTYALIKDDFEFIDRGPHEIKGFGTRRLYTLEGEHPRR